MTALGKNQIKRNLTIGFYGRTGSLTAKRLTWGEKSYSGKTWTEFKNASVTGDTHSENDESVTVALTVLDISTANSGSVALPTQGQSDLAAPSVYPFLLRFVLHDPQEGFHQNVPPEFQ